MYQLSLEAADFIKQKTTLSPKIAIILGTGLSELSTFIEEAIHLPYKSIPNFPVSTVSGHKGELIIGYLSGRPVMVMAGRFHYYEGYSMKEVTFPIRVFQQMGISHLIVSNAAGGVQEAYKDGDIVFIKDHINLFPENPLRGQNDSRLGIRFPDMLHAYDPAWLSQGLLLAEKLSIKPQSGIYLGLQGPNLETPAEYQFIHNAGADLVGMSTIPEVIVAQHAGIKVLAMSIVSNVCYPIDQLTETTIEDAVAMVQSVSPKIQALVKLIVAQTIIIG